MQLAPLLAFLSFVVLAKSENFHESGPEISFPIEDASTLGLQRTMSIIRAPVPMQDNSLEVPPGHVSSLGRATQSNLGQEVKGSSSEVLISTETSKGFDLEDDEELNFEDGSLLGLQRSVQVTRKDVEKDRDASSGERIGMYVFQV
mmetsp:Transcript_82993/g.130915  ORF Transcript_82993/g.130915 Transcript_82993/m.130915 type:complete len:146 (+) Transcript_82993:52-489(+)